MLVYDGNELIDRKAFANRLRSLRKEKKFTQDRVAKEIGVQKLAYGNYERGIRLPDVERIYCLAKLFNVSIDNLLDHKLNNFDSAKWFWESKGFKINNAFKSDKIELKFSFQEESTKDREGSFNIPSETTTTISLQNKASFINLTQNISQKCKLDVCNYEKKVIIDNLKKMNLF